MRRQNSGQFCRGADLIAAFKFEFLPRYMVPVFELVSHQSQNINPCLLRCTFIHLSLNTTYTTYTTYMALP